MSTATVTGMQPPADARRRTALAAAAAAGLVFAGLALLGIAVRPLLPVDETRYVAVAWEMWRDGHILVPHLNGAVYTHKPPLLFWLIDLAWSVAGVSDIAARLVGPAFGVLSVLLTGVLARTLWPEDRGVAVRAPWILATLGVFLVFASLTMFDAMLTAATLLAMIGLARQRKAPDRLGWLGVGAALALGAFAKGPVILLHVMPVALLAPLWCDRASRPAAGTWYRGVGLAFLFGLGLVSVWLVPAAVWGGPAYRDAILWHQSADRMVSSFAHREPAWFFLALLPAFLWPWGWRPAVLRALGSRALLRDEAVRFCLVWAGAALLAFSLISGKQVHYLLPELPALALLLARAWPRAAETSAAERKRWRLLPLIPGLLIVAGAAAVLLGLVPHAREEGLTVDAASVALALGLLAALAAAVLAMPNRFAAWALIAPGTLLIFYAVAATPLRTVYDSALLAEAAAPYASGGLAYTGGDYHGEFTFAGRLASPVAELRTPGEIAAWAATHPGGAVIGRAERMSPGWPAVREINFRGRAYRIWPVPKVAPPPQEGSPTR